MIKIKNKIKLLVVFLLAIIIPILLILKGIIRIDVIIQLGENLQFNFISFFSVLCGFSFTAVSILISIIDKEQIKRLWDNSYLDNLYYSSFISMFADLVEIFVALYIVFNNITDNIWFVVEIITLSISLLFFVYSIIKLFILIQDLKL